MKSLPRLFIAPALVLFCLLASCAKPQPVNPGTDPGTDPGTTPDPPVDKVELTASLDKLASSAYGGTYQATVATNQAEWTATVSGDAKEWITLEISGATVTITVLENTGTEDRTGTVTISAGGKKIDIPVRQDAATALPDGGENTTLTYSLSEGTVVAPRDFASYITSIDKSFHTFTVSKSVPAEMLPTVPSTLVINTPTEVIPGGLLCNVYAMEEVADGYLFYYNNGDITQAFKELNIDTEGLDLGGYVTEVVDAEGNPLPFVRTKAATQEHFHITLPQVGWDLPLGFSITPKMDLDIALKLQMIVGDYKISTLNIKVDLDASIGADLELMVEASATKYFKLVSVYFAAIPVGPVVLTPSVDIYALVGVDGKIGLAASASTVLHTSAALHYDELSGLSGDVDASDPQPGETKYSAGPKIEAGLFYGLGVGPAIGIYTDIIQAGVTLNLKRREYISTSINLAQVPSGPDAWISESIINSEFSISWLLNAALHLRAFGVTKDVDTPDLTFPYATYKMFPPFEKEYDYIQEGDGFTIETRVTGPSMFPGCPGSDTGELVLCVKEQGNALATNMIFPFDLDPEKAQALWDDPDTPQTIRATAMGLISGYNYSAFIAWRFAGSVIPLMRLENMMAIDGNHLRAIRAILSDIKACAAGNWEGCDWDDDKKSISKLKNVSLSYGTDYENPGKKVYELKIDLPTDWKLSSNFTVSNHSSGIDDLSWDIRLHQEYEGQKWNFDNISIEDEAFDTFWGEVRWHNFNMFGNVTTKKYLCRGKRCRAYPDTTEEIDVSGSGCFYLYFGTEGGSWDQNHLPSKILADNCLNMESIDLNYPEGKSAQFSARNCPKLEKLYLNGRINFSPETLSGLGTPEDSRSLILNCPGTASVSIGSGWTSVSISNIGSVSVSGARDLKALFIYTGVTNLSISDCPNMNDLGASFADNGDLETFSISGTPQMSYLAIGGNHKLTMKVPAVFDQIRNNGGKLSYDIRYEYTELYEDKGPVYYDIYGTWRLAKQDGYRYTYYHDNGYGFYYEGEPTRGYHRQ